MDCYIKYKHKKMNRRVPTGISVAIILFLTAAVVLVWRNIYASVIDAGASANNIQTSGAVIAKSKPAKCKPKAFAGNEKIRGWYVDGDSQKLFQVSKEDLGLLPVPTDGSERVSKLKLIDIDPVLDKKLSASSEKNPQSITIEGYALPCDGNALASLNYKDGIFSSQLGIAN